MPTFIKGEDLILSVSISSVWYPIACLTSNTISQTKSIIETQTKCDPGVVIRASGSRSYEVSFDGIYIDTTSTGSADTDKASHDRLKTLFETDDEQTWRMDTGLTDVPYYYGTGIFQNLELTAGSGDEFTQFTGSISGSGAIVSVDPT
jgi:predicted secreted protein